MRFQQRYRNSQTRFTVAEAVEARCDKDFVEGAFEKVVADLNATVELLGRLTERLTNKGLLSSDDIAAMLFPDFDLTEEEKR